MEIFWLPTKFRSRLLQTPTLARTNYNPVAIYTATRTTPRQAYYLTKSWQTPTGADSPCFPSTGSGSDPLSSKTRRNLTKGSISAAHLIENLRPDAVPGRSWVDLRLLSCPAPAASRDWLYHPSWTSRPLGVHYSALSACLLEQLARSRVQIALI